MLSSFTLQVIYLITTLLVPVQAETYWVDTASCNGKLLAADGSSAIITEALRFASRAAIRNRAGAGDSNMARLFKLIWKVPQSDTDANDQVESIMESIGKTTVSPTREAADVRIYCDGDETSKTGGASARWQLVPDRAQEPHGQVNSQKTTGQEWYDQVNFVRRSTDINGCLDAETLAETYTTPMSASDPQVPSSENPQRSVITMCNVVFNDALYTISTLSSVPPKGLNLAAITLQSNMLRALPSLVLLHEWTHTNAYGGKLAFIHALLYRDHWALTVAPADDVKNKDSYGWIGVQSLSAELSLQNAENYAYFGLIAGLADKFIRLTTSSPSEVRKGVLVYDQGIPPEKRSLAVDGYTRTNVKGLP